MTHLVTKVASNLFVFEVSIPKVFLLIHLSLFNKLKLYFLLTLIFLTYLLFDLHSSFEQMQNLFIQILRFGDQRSLS